MTEPLFLSIPRAAARLGVSAKTVKRMVAAGELPSLHVRRRVVIPTKALDQWVEQNTKQAS